MRLLPFLLILTYIFTTYSRRPFSRPMPWSKGEKCSKKVTNLCKNIPRIKKCMSKGNDCENLNKKEPKRNTKKKAYCRNVRCVQSGRNSFSWCLSYLIFFLKLKNVAAPWTMLQCVINKETTMTTLSVLCAIVARQRKSLPLVILG